MDESLPYRVRYALGEDQCQKCKQQIDLGCLRIAIMVQVFSSIISSHCENIRFNSNVQQAMIDVHLLWCSIEKAKPKPFL